jgi:ferric-dicitrate binding protein FerR (iron transport regulator)
MNKQDKHIKNMNHEQLADKLLEGMEIPFSATKEESWEAIAAKMKQTPENIATVSKSRSLYYFPAAAVALILLAFGVMRFYTKTYISENQSMSFSTPDGSSVFLSPHSKASFQPLWMKIQRELRLEGIAQFDVEKGNKFKVISEQAYTQVLGTSFLIDASNINSYKVECFTGSVSVTDAKTELSAIITANESLKINNKGEFEIKLLSPTQKNLKPTQNFLTFQAVPLVEVATSLSRQYGAKIVLQTDEEIEFSGHLDTANKLEDIIAAICLSLDLKYEKISETEYHISP